MKTNLLMISLMLIVNVIFAQGGTWNTEGPSANFAATCSAGPGIALAITNDGKLYMDNFSTGNGWQLCVTLPSGIGIIKSISAMAGLDCPAWVTTSSGQIFKFNYCECTYVLGSTIPQVQGGATDITWTSASTAYVSCGNGAVYKTTNEGNSWTAMPTGVITYLTDIYSEYGTNNIYVIGDMGTVISTTNGGDSWTQHNPGSQVFLSKLSPIGNNLFLISGSDGFLTQWDGLSGFTPYSTGTTLGFIGFDGSYWAGSPYAGINVGDNGSYSFLQPDLTWTGIQYIPGVTDYLKSVTTTVKPGGKSAPDTLIAIAAGSDGLYRYKEPYLPSTVDETSKKGFQVFPNPVNGILHFSLPDALTNPTLTLLDHFGRKIWQIPLPADSQIDLSALPAACYLLQITAKEGLYSTKVIKL